MKKLMKKINFALIAAMATAPAFAAPGGSNDAFCLLADKFGYVFSIIRTLAFIGAGITIAGWAWGYIEKGEVKIIEEVKKKGVGMLVGFVLLFSIGTVLQVFMSMAGPGGSFECDVNTFFGGVTGM